MLRNIAGSDGLIVFEGPDATGKSRLSTLLAEMTGHPRIVTPGRRYAAIASEVKRAGTVESLLLFLTTCAAAAEEHARSERRATILDRFWLSSLVAHASAISMPIPDLPGLLEWVLRILPAPRLTVLLTSDQQARLERLRARPQWHPREVCPVSDRYWDAMAELLPRWCDDVLVLDTSSPDTGPPLAAICRALAAAGLLGDAEPGTVHTLSHVP